MLTYRKENKKMKNLLYFVAGFGAGIAAIKLEQKYYGYCEKLIGNVKKKITGDGIEEVKEIPAEEKN